MSVDSDIPAFRLNPPALSSQDKDDENKRRVSTGTPALFALEPKVAWGRAGRSLLAFRRAEPHRGYALLRAWTRRPGVAGFVVTSNVDGLFFSAGFDTDEVLEGHGSMHHLQCSKPCNDRVWSAESWQPEILDNGCAAEPLPRCDACGALARPNVFMFGDLAFVPTRSNEQAARFEALCAELASRQLVVIEIGAGTTVPTIRDKCAELAARYGAPHVRINFGEAQGPPGTIAIPLAAREALERIDEALLARA